MTTDVQTIPGAALVDRFGRVHRSLRISITDRCQLRCSYCMPAQGLAWIPRPDVLTVDEIVRVAGLCVDSGVAEIRLTGGEPLVRPEVVEIVQRLAGLTGPAGRVEVAMTTNGLRLAELARPLAAAGLTRVNVSLDTLRRDRYLTLSRRDRLDDVLAGIQAAEAAGLRPIKLNSLVLPEVNSDEIVELVAFAVGSGYDIRFIEQMPLGAERTWRRDAIVVAGDVLAAVAAVYQLSPVAERGSAPARTWLVDGGPTRLGLIASVTAPFCGACDRIRLTADGCLRSCLFAATETDLRTVIRAGADDDQLVGLIQRCVAGKAAGHLIGQPGFTDPQRSMSAIGG